MKRFLATLLITLCFSGIITATEPIHTSEPSSPEAKGYILVGKAIPETKHIGLHYDALQRDFFRSVGFDYSEHPHCTGIGGHMDGEHLAVVHDETLNEPVLRFDIHITPVIDGDHCSGTDWQRNELKTTHSDRNWAQLLNGQWDKWQMLEWKMKIPKGFQPTQAFCHIHQIKAQDGPNNGAPVITLTLCSNRDGSNSRVQVIHASSGGSGRSLGILTEAPLSEFEDEWVQVVQEKHFRHNGFYSINITRIRDGKVFHDREKGHRHVP